MNKLKKANKAEEITLTDRLVAVLDLARKITGNLGISQKITEDEKTENTINAIVDLVSAIDSELNSVDIEVKRLKCVE